MASNRRRPQALPSPPLAKGFARRLPSGLGERTAQMVDAPRRGVQKLAASVGQLGSLSNLLFRAFRARALCTERHPARS